MLFAAIAMILVLNIDSPINCQVTDPCDKTVVDKLILPSLLSGSVLVCGVHWKLCHRRCIDPFDAQDHCHLDAEPLGDRSSRHPFSWPVGYPFPWYGVMILSTLDDPDMSIPIRYDDCAFNLLS